MGVALLAGPANVIVQLARPGVGYGVMESRVESGRVGLHPIKRARTTFTYLAVATGGKRRRPPSVVPSTRRMPRCIRRPTGGSGPAAPSWSHPEHIGFLRDPLEMLCPEAFEDQAGSR